MILILALLTLHLSALFDVPYLRVFLLPPELSLPGGGGQRASLPRERVFWEEMTPLNYSFHEGLRENRLAPSSEHQDKGVHAMKLEQQMEIKWKAARLCAAWSCWAGFVLQEVVCHSVWVFEEGCIPSCQLTMFGR